MVLMIYASPTARKTVRCTVDFVEFANGDLAGTAGLVGLRPRQMTSTIRLRLLQTPRVRG